MKNKSKRILCCCAIVFGMLALPSQASVLTDFAVAGGNAGSSIDLTWSNLNSTVTMVSSGGSTPAIDSVKNTMTATASGVIQMNVLAVDDLSSNFQPAKWIGGGQSAGNSINADPARGWGVRHDLKVNGNLQLTEALFLTFDLSALTLEAGQSVVLKGITFYGTGDVWKRNFSIAEGESFAGNKLANDVITYAPANMTISDGDLFAVMRGDVDARLSSLELDVIPEPAPMGLVLAGAGVIIAIRRMQLR